MSGIKVVANNKKARHDYFIEDTYETGIVLTGTEIKSIRQGKVNIKESYAKIENGEMILYGMHISPYEHGNRFNVDPLRPRKLLLHKREIQKPVSYTHLESIIDTFFTDIKIFTMIQMQRNICLLYTSRCV